MISNKYKHRKSRVEYVKETAHKDSRYTPMKQWDEIHRLYGFDDSGEIKDFVSHNTQILSALLEAPEHVRRIFGDVPLHLELHHDPEEGWDELFIVIKTSYSAKKAIELENKLFDEWFVHVMPSTKNKLCITEEPA